MADLPARIGAYRVTSQLGEGGMGVVYAAVDDKLNRPVAVKMIRDAGADARTLLARGAGRRVCQPSEHLPASRDC